MTLKEVLRQIKSLEKSLKGETDLNNVLEIWGKLDFLGKIKIKEVVTNEPCI